MTDEIENFNIVPMFFELHPRNFENEYMVGIATTAADADQYQAEGFATIEKERALYLLSRRRKDGESEIYASATLDGAAVEDRFELARRVRRGEIES